MNQFSRLELLIGKEAFKKIEDISICVIGIGGVGSYVVESLIRSGVKNIVIVDYDTIDITNLNRQLMTDLNNIGLKKVDCFEKRILSINKDVNITKIDKFIDETNINMLFDLQIDYLIDCCDSLNTKKLIIKECLNKNIKFITCCGMGNRLDPSKIEICDIKKTSYDPIAKILRSFLKKEMIKGKVLCCCSTEKPIKVSSKTIGSNAFVPASAGLMITSYIIRNIIKEN